MIDFLLWLRSHVDFRFVLTPVAMTNIRKDDGRISHIGYSNIFVFGVRIARIQRTKTW